MHPVSTPFLPSGLAAVARRVRRALSAGYAAWLRHHRVRATVHALGLLDRHALRDLALDRSELHSLAAELHGTGGRDRRHGGSGAPQPR